MATRVIKTFFQLRRGQSEAWHRVNPILLPGEPGFELDTNKLKIGNGVDAYNDLKYISGNFEINEENGSIALDEEGNLEIFGMKEAIAGQIPTKGPDGKIQWIDLPQSTLEWNELGK